MVFRYVVPEIGFNDNKITFYDGPYNLRHFEILPATGEGGAF